MNYRHDLEKIEVCPRERQIIELILDGKISTALYEARLCFVATLLATPALLLLTAFCFMLAYSALFSQSAEVAVKIDLALRAVIVGVWLIFLLEQLCHYHAKTFKPWILITGTLGSALLFSLAGSVENGSRFTIAYTFLLAVATFGLMGSSHSGHVDVQSQDINDKRLLVNFHLTTLLPGLIFSLYASSLRELAAWSSFGRIDKQRAVNLLYGAANHSGARLRQLAAQHGSAYAQRLVGMLESLKLVYRVKEEIRLTRDGEVTLKLREAST